MPFAEILTVGDELLSGETADTNSSLLDAELEARGWTVLRHTTVGDDLDRIAAAFDEIARRVELVICSGGLGPTQDDLTLEGLSRALGCGLRRDERTIGRIAEMFRRLGREMTPNNERQAMVPEIGEVIDNHSGTAPAFTAPLHKAQVFLLPGVPREVRWLIEHAVGPRIDRGAPSAFRRTVKVVGLGESRLEHAVRDVVKAHPGVRWGYRTLGIENHVKLAASSAEILAVAEADLRRVLGDRMFGTDKEDLPSVVGELLRGRSETVAAAESCTGGLCMKLLTDVPGSSDYVIGGAVTYANRAKIEIAGVKAADLEAHGAVSRPVAQQLAEGIRERFGTTWGIGITGVAGPGGGTPEKPVGLVFVAVAGPEGPAAIRELRLPGDRATIRNGSALVALEILRRKLKGASEVD